MSTRITCNAATNCDPDDNDNLAHADSMAPTKPTSINHLLHRSPPPPLDCFESSPRMSPTPTTTTCTILKTPKYPQLTIACWHQTNSTKLLLFIRLPNQTLLVFKFNQSTTELQMKMESTISSHPMQMDDSNASSSSSSSFNQLATTKLAQSIKTIISTMMMSTTTTTNNDNHQINEPQIKICDDDLQQSDIIEPSPETNKSTGTDDHKNDIGAHNDGQPETTITTNSGATNSCGFDWPHSFLELLNSLSLKQQSSSSSSNVNSVLSSASDGNAHDENQQTLPIDNCNVNSNRNANHPSDSPTSTNNSSPISSLAAADDGELELMGLQHLNHDDHHQHTTNDETKSPWLMNFVTMNVPEPNDDKQTSDHQLAPTENSPTVDWNNNNNNAYETSKSDKPQIINNNNNNDDDNNDNNNDRNLINLVQFLCNESNGHLNNNLHNDMQPSLPTPNDPIAQCCTQLLRRRKSLPLCFNQITLIDFNRSQHSPTQPQTKTTTTTLVNNHGTIEIHTSDQLQQDFEEDDDDNVENNNNHLSIEQAPDKGGQVSLQQVEERNGHQQDQEQHQSLASQQQRQPKQPGTGSDPSAAPSADYARTATEDGKYSLLQFALYNFREAIDKYSLESRASKAPSQAGDTSTLRGSLKLIESLRNSSQESGAKSQQGTKERKSNGRTRLPLVTGSSGSGILGGNSNNNNADWTWRELAEMVKFTSQPLRQSLLKLPSDELNKRALDCFLAIMQYMGDFPAAATTTNTATTNSKHHPQPLPIQGGEVECVYLILMNCHNYPILRDEIYCQLMKQTTSNRSQNPDSCLRGWRLFSIVAAYFDCSQSFKPYLLKYLETAAYDKRRAYCSVAALCLQNLRKTFKYNGRKNVPSIEEIAATSAGRNSKRQIYRLPGGTERVINTKSTTVVDDIIHEICSNMLNVTEPDEMLEFSLYCIADGDLYTMPLNRDEYILDITTELIKNHQQYFLIFCRSIWHYPLRLDSKLYIEVIFNQIAPDYLEGLLLVLPSSIFTSSSRRDRDRSNPDGSARQPLRLKSKLVKEVARIAALLHRASGTDYMPHKDEVKYLLPKPIITAMKYHQRAGGSSIASDGHHPAGSGASSTSGSSSARLHDGSINSGPRSLAATTNSSGQEDGQHTADGMVITTPSKWVELVQNNWRDMSAFDTLDAKAQFLDIIRHWPLFGSSFFAIKFIQRDLIQPMDYILALNKLGIHMLDMSTHETIHKYPFNEVISTRKVRSEDGALFLDLKCGNLMKRTIIRIQTDQAHEISRLIRQYIDIELLQQKQLHQQQLLQQSAQQPTSHNTVAVVAPTTTTVAVVAPDNDPIPDDLHSMPNPIRPTTESKTTS